MFSLSPSAHADDNGTISDDEFAVMIDGYENGLVTAEDRVVPTTPINSEPLDTPAAGLKLIYFEAPNDSNRARLQINGSVRSGTYCLATNGDLGVLSLVPPDWSDGSDTPYNTPQGTLGCVPLTPAELAAAGLEIAEENGQTVLRTIRVTLTTHDFDTFPIAPATPHQEKAPHTLKNYNTNFWADPNPQEFTRTINGQNVTLRATPVTYTFTYGDGSVLGPTSYPGQALGEDIWDQPTSTSHQYAEPGDYQFTLTTTYRGEYSVEGGPWQVIDGTVSRTSEPQLVRVWRTQVGLVADDCTTNPNAWGCES
ncbi:hypothetical protein [Rothia nasimurium]|uniref:hypothetical protein n=1 Tax=Rothia nasimurium TaxID=85336 RepID=UPI001F3CA780|nr:hypothetical protein [Rothia nasimurium]